MHVGLLMYYIQSASTLEQLNIRPSEFRALLAVGKQIVFFPEMLIIRSFSLA